MKHGAALRRSALSTHYYCLLAVALTLAACSTSPQARRDKFLARGEDYYQKQNFARALLEYKNANQAKPDDPEVFYQMGLAYAALKDPRLAVAAFRKTLELDPKHRLAQLRIAELMTGASDPKILEDAEKQLEKLVESSADAETLDTLAVAEMKLGKSENAIQSLERALNDFRGGLNSTILLAKVKWDQKDFKGTEEALRKAANDLPKSAYTHRLLGEFYMVRARNPEAEAELRQAIQVDPSEGLAQFDLARLQLAEGKKQDAEQTFKQLAGKASYRPIYGVFLFQSGRRDEALREFEKVAQANPDDREARAYLLAAYQALDRPADIEKTLTAALKKNPRDTVALFQRGEIFLQRKKYEQAEADINALAKISPEAPEAHYLRAQLQRGRGAARSYRQELTEALRLNPALLDLRIELAQDLINSHEGQAALETLEAALQSQKKTVNFTIARNWALWTKGDLPEMRKGIDAGLARERNVDFLRQDGLWKLRSGNAKAAISVLEESLNSNPGSVIALEALNAAYIAQKEKAEGIRKVKEYAARAPKSAPVQNYLGELLLANGDRAEARTVFSSAKAADPASVDADLGLTKIDFADHKYEEARARLQAILATDPGNLRALVRLGIIEEARGDYPAAIDNLRKVLAITPDNTEAGNNLAYLLSEHDGNLDEALRYAQKALELAPKRLDYADTLGWILYRKGLYSQSIQYLDKSGSDPHNALWKYHLAMAYAKIGDHSHSRSALDAAIKLNPNLPEAKLAKAMVAPSK